MKCLYLFEDTNGFSEIFKAGLNITTKDKLFIFGDNIIKVGCTQKGALCPDSLTAKLFEEYNITKVVHVFDVDSLSGYGSKILTVNEIERVSKKFKQNYDVESVYIPIVYCAETVLLHQYFISKNFDLLRYVNIKNTKSLHYKTLKHFIDIQLGKPSEVKKTYEYLDYSKLKSRFIDAKHSYATSFIVDWMKRDFKDIDNIGFNYNELLIFIDKLCLDFERYKQDVENGLSITVNDKLVQLNNITV